jgi:hypothetical protein
VAIFADALSSALAGVGQEVFNASILALAVVMLSWHNIWMARHGRELAAHTKEIGEAVAAGSRSLAALAVVVGVAVLREGSEIVLFLYSLTLSGGASMWELLAGGVVGLLAGCAVSALTFFGLVKIPARYLFGVHNDLNYLPCCGTCRPECRIPSTGWPRHCPGPDRLGYIRNPPRQQSHWSCAAYTRWLHRSASRDAGCGLRDNAAHHIFSHTITRPDQAWAARAVQRSIVSP